MRMINISWYHIRRSPYQALAAVLATFVTLLLSGIFFLATMTSVYILHFFEGKPQVIIFFKDTATESDITGIQKTIEATGKTASIRYISKNQALDTYKQLNKNDPLLLEMVTADILPSSLEISAKEPAFLAEIEASVRQSPLVDQIEYQKDVVEALITWTNAIRLIGLTLGILLILNAILTIMTVVGMKIALRQDEVEILSLIGATPGYIRSPFIVEGALYGTIGAFGSWVVMTSILVWIRPYLYQFLSVIPEVGAVLHNPLSAAFIVPISLFGIGMICVGILLGVIGSSVAVGRYLRT